MENCPLVASLTGLAIAILFPHPHQPCSQRVKVRAPRNQFDVLKATHNDTWMNAKIIRKVGDSCRAAVGPLDELFPIISRNKQLFCDPVGISFPRVAARVALQIDENTPRLMNQHVSCFMEQREPKDVRPSVTQVKLDQG